MKRIEKVRLKLKRAQKHIHDFEAAAGVFLEDAYVIGTKPNSKLPDWTTYYIKEAHPIPPYLSLFAGDCIHNLRSVLDHLVWRLVEAYGVMQPGDHTAFPIFDVCQKTSKIDTAKSLARKIQGVHPDAEKAIGLLQPYKSGDMMLWHIHQLDIMDKHKLILEVASCPTNWGLKREGIWLGETSGIVFDAQAGDELCNFPASTVGVDEDNIEFGFDIAFNDPTIIAGKSVLLTLNGMADFVDKIITDFKPLLD